MDLSENEAIGEEAFNSISKNGLSVDDFSYKSAGVAGYFEKIRNGSKAENFIPGSRVLYSVESAETWCPKSSKQKEIILPLVESRLLPLLSSAFELYEKRIPGAMPER